VRLLERPSPNHDERPAAAAVDMLVLHYTGMASCEAALERLCDPTARVSAHYLIDEGGACYRLVAEGRRAWHAGISSWRGESDINDRSVGIELANPGHEFGYRPFPELQMACLTELAVDITARLAIPAARVVGHADVAPTRRADPGELFDWRRLALAGVGLWPPDTPPSRWDGDIEGLQHKLGALGYAVGAPGIFDAATRAAVIAFQRHYVRTRVDGEVDARTFARLEALLASIP